MNFELVKYFFLWVYPYFLVEIIVCEALFVFRCKRKPLFIVRLVTGLALCCAFTFLITCVQFCLADSVIVNTTAYILMFAFTLVILKVCFNEPFKILLLCGVAAYAVQNLGYRLYTLFEITGVVWKFATAIGSYELAGSILTILIFIVTDVFVYVVFVRKMNAKGLESVYSPNVLLLSAFTLFVTVILCSFTNIWWWQHFYLSVINYCFTVLCNLFILVILSGMTERGALKADLQIVRQLWEQDKRQYEISKETIELINIKCHDLKHKLRELRLADGAIDKDELKEFENAIAIYDGRVHTGSAPLDVLLTEKSFTCGNSGIKLECLVDGAALSFMSEYDLYSLFGNILSNAIEAVQNIKEEQNRVINLTASVRFGAVMINCVNYYDGEIKIVGGLPQTNKADKEQHGFGMKSMRLLVKKYGGELNFRCGGGVFNLTAMLPAPKNSDGKKAA